MSDFRQNFRLSSFFLFTHLLLLISLILVGPKLALGQQMSNQQLLDSLSKNDCGIRINYAPVIPAHTPIKFVRLTFHVFQKSDSTGNFINNELHRKFLRQHLIKDLNKNLGKLAPMNLPTPTPYIPDSRVRYSLDTMIFHQTDEFYNVKPELTKRSNTKSGNLIYQKFVIENENLKHKETSLHVFWLGDAKSSQASGIANHKWVIMNGGNNVQTDPFPKGWKKALWLRHELGHSLGLMHTWRGDDVKDTPIHPHCWNYNEPANNPACSIPSNNVMDYVACQCALTAGQIAKIQSALSGNIGTISKVVIDSFENHDPIYIRIGEKITWNSNKSFANNILIESGAELIVKCKINFKNNYGIYLAENGLLSNLSDEKLFYYKKSNWFNAVFFKRTIENQQNHLINLKYIRIMELPPHL
ncbi:MAG: hypothetical protein ACJATA_000714 [Sphingobacteriales bacterium]|jgi:hypothetical protein